MCPLQTPAHTHLSTSTPVLPRAISSEVFTPGAITAEVFTLSATSSSKMGRKLLYDVDWNYTSLSELMDVFFFNKIVNYYRGYT